MSRLRQPLPLLLAFVVASVAALVIGCELEPEPAAEIDEEAILELLDDGDDYDDYVRVTAAPVLSQHGDAMVHVWLPPELADQYLAIDPDNRAPTSFPRGTLIIKEQLDSNGEPITATLLFKGPEGYNPQVADWWFGTADLVTNELIESGPDIPSCIDCHSSAETSDFVHGLP